MVYCYVKACWHVFIFPAVVAFKSNIAVKTGRVFSKAQSFTVKYVWY